MATPSRLNNGLSTHAVGHPLANFPLPDPIQTSSNGSNYDVFSFIQDYTDLGQVLAYTVTGGSSTFALESGLGGYSVLTPGGATTASSVYRNAQSFQFISGNQFWFVQKIITGLFATTGTYAFGINNGSSGTDGLWFTKPASSTNINLVSSVQGTVTTLVTGVTTHTTGSLAAGATTQYSTAVTVTSTAALLVGQFVYGTGIPLNSTVTAITSATAFTISAPATATGSGLTIIYASTIDVSFWYNGTDLLVYSSDILIARITAPTIGDASTFTLSSVLTNHFISCTPTATDLIHSDYTFIAQEMSR